MAYLQAVMGNVFGKLTWEHATEQLENTLNVLAMAGRLPVYPRPVRTLQSARRRLGIDPDTYIIQYALCMICWKHHTPEQLKDLAGPQCRNRNCTGLIYRVENGARIPLLINPQVSIIGSLRRMFLRPGFAKMVTKNPNHQPGRNNNDDFVMKDMPDGDMWYHSSTSTRCKVGSHGTIWDVSIDGGPVTKLFSHHFGLQLTLNTDWWVFRIAFA